jgi:hypothetical protein
MGVCDCSCDILDGPFNELEVETWHTARKEWVCCECAETIKPGDSYQLWSLLNDGSWSKERTCAPCARIRSDLCSCWIFGELRESVWECLGFDYLTGEDRDDDR